MLIVATGPTVATNEALEDPMREMPFTIKKVGITVEIMAMSPE